MKTFPRRQRRSTDPHRGVSLQRKLASVASVFGRRAPPFGNMGCNLLLLAAVLLVVVLIVTVVASDSIGQWRMHREAQHLRQTLTQLEVEQATLDHVRTVLHDQGIRELYRTGGPGTYQGFTHQFWGLGDCRVFVTFSVDSDERLRNENVDEGCQFF